MKRLYVYSIDVGVKNNYALLETLRNPATGLKRQGWVGSERHLHGLDFYFAPMYSTKPILYFPEIFLKMWEFWL
jgi:hypothetical protein